MNKIKIKERQKHVRDAVNLSSEKSSIVVRRLAKELFLSERTIWDDLKA